MLRLVKCLVPILLGHLLMACDSVDNISKQPEARRFIGRALCLRKYVFVAKSLPPEEPTTYSIFNEFLPDNKIWTVAQYQALLDERYSLDKEDRALTIVAKIPRSTRFVIEELWKVFNSPDVGTYFVPISQLMLPKYGNLRVDVGQLLVDSYSYTLKDATWDRRYVAPCQMRLHKKRLNKSQSLGDVKSYKHFSIMRQTT